MGLDVRDLGELLLESVGGAQNVGIQGIRRLQHQEGLLALRVDAFEVHRRARHGIAGHDEAVDRRVRGDLGGVIDAGCCQDHENGHDPEPRAQHAEEDLVHRFGVHSRACGAAE